MRLIKLFLSSYSTIDRLEKVNGQTVICHDPLITYSHFSIFIYADDIYEEVSSSLQPLGLDTECLGGGRIAHNPSGKPQIKVYGYSQVNFAVATTEEAFN